MIKYILDNSHSRTGNRFIIFNLIAPIGKCYFFNLLNFNFSLRWMQNLQVAAFWENKADNVHCKPADFCLYSCVSVKISLKKILKWVSFILVYMDIDTGTGMGTT